MILHSRPTIDECDIAAVVECLRSEQVGAGQGARLLEQRVAEDCGFAWGVAFSCASQAIEMAFRLRQARRVAVPGYICRTVYEAVVRSGCQPVLTDISPETFATAELGDCDAAVVAHMFGIPAQPMNDGRQIVEDWAMRLPLARGEAMAEFAVLSLDATKMWTGGQGGLLLGRHPADEADLRDWLETRWKLPFTDLQAALAMSQWQRRHEFALKRRVLADRYLRSGLASQAHPAMRRKDVIPFRFVLQVEDPESLIAFAATRGVACRRPVQPLAELPETQRAWKSIVSLPLYPALTEAEQDRVIEVVETCLSCRC